MFHNALIINSLRKTSLFFVALLFTHLAFGQNPVVFEATTNARQVPLDGYFDVVFTLAGANGTQFAPPSFKDFVILSGPSTSTSMQIINGNVSREMSFSYTLQASKTGTLSIGSASIKVNGNTLRTKPISIDVVKGSPKPNGGGGQDFFVRVEPSKRRAFVGEQVMLDFKLYTKVAIEGYDIPEDPSYDGFYAVELRRFNANTMQETLGGQQYATKVLRRIALFPQKTGKLTIDPFRIQLALIEDDGKPGFFFSRNIKPVYFTTNSIEVDVEALPGNEPDGFCGAVGIYELQAGIDRKTATTDDAVSLKIIVTGNGDIKRVQPPTILLSDSLEVYEPKVIGEKTDEVQGEIVSEKTFEYLILPKYPGQFTISPQVSYFNVKAGQFSSFQIGPFNLAVKAGSGKSKTSKENSVNKSLNDILPIKSTTAFSDSTFWFPGSILFYILLVIPLLLVTLLFISQKLQKPTSEVDTAQNKIRSAGREAQKHLTLAQFQLQNSNSRGFYDEVSKALYGFICAKTSLSPSQITNELIMEKLLSMGVTQTLINEFLRLIQACETALYAGMDNAASMNSIYENAIVVITSIEDELNKK